MAKHIFDKDGFHIGEFVKGVVIDEGDQVIEIEIPHGVFYQPRLVDGEIVEGLSQEEIEAIKNQPKELSMEEQLALAVAELDAQRERDKTAIQLAIAELGAAITTGSGE